jgi:hypothetical protein
MHLVKVTETPADASCRNTVGGSPFMPPGSSVPRCRLCNARMVLFFQLDIRSEFGLPFRDGSHLLVFMCPTHNEPPLLPSIYNDSPLPESYWDAETGHYSLLLFPPSDLISDGHLDEHIASYSLSFEHAQEEIHNFGEFDIGSYEFKIGGVPGWMNYSIDKRCTCGGEMTFICQTPDGFGFKQTPAAPEQPDSFSSTEYCLFLGNQVYILACNRQCDPRAVIAGCDN